MARGVNKVILVGNLGADPEKRVTSGGTTVTSLRLATSESWKDKNTGERQERTEWHRVKLFGKLGEIAAEYLRKGQQVYIEGSIRTDKFTGQDGVEKYFTDVIANEMNMLGGGGGGGGGGSSGGDFGGGSRERSSSYSSGGGQPSGGGQRQPSGGGSQSPSDSNFQDDDIPF